MKKYFLTVLIAFQFVSSQEPATLTAEIVVNADTGWPVKIIIRGYSPFEKIWMGLSLYPYATASPETDGKHTTMQLSEGEIYHEISVDSSFLDGSFEAALWGKKVNKVDCTLEYCYWCKVNGYHLDDLQAYKSGLLTQLNGY